MKYRKVISCHFSEGSAGGGKEVGRVSRLRRETRQKNVSGSSLRSQSNLPLSPLLCGQVQLFRHSPQDKPLSERWELSELGLEGDKKGKVRSTNEI